MPLNQVLIDIRDQFDVDFSFNDTELSKYNISVSKTFENVDEALTYLLKDLPFTYERFSGVYTIYPAQKEIEPEKKKPKVYRISGRIMEAKTNEVLPYSNILVNSTGIISDHNGNFMYSSTKDSVFNIKISHLGYLLEDTILNAVNKNVQIYMTPSDQLIEEIKVSDRLIETFSNSGNEVATIKLNHKVTKYLPGSSDNSVFNLLRLQPGILASGEQTNDLIIWGSYAGQSRVIFDGFTVFGLKNFNDNISAINPLITKNIQVKKAGYDASYGDCVGGIVDIAGKDGNTRKPHLNLGINNLTLNSLLEIPILHKSSLQFAYRQTYYNLYKDGYNIFEDIAPQRNSDLADITIYPEYTFRDFNVKYSYKGDHNSLYVSLLNSIDDFDYSFSETRQYREIIKSTNEGNHQTGAAIYLEKKISPKLNSNLTLSYSSLATEIKNNLDVYSTITNQLRNQIELKTNNEIQELKAKFQAQYQTKKNHSLEFLAQTVSNLSKYQEDSSAVNIISTSNNKSYLTFGFKDIISFQNKKLKVGFRASYLPYLEKAFFEPRISFSHNLGEKFGYNLAWGLYNQFLVKISAIDEYGNYRYLWVISDDKEIPVLRSNHFIGGFSYNNQDFSFTIDGFYKTVDGITRYFRFLQSSPQSNQPGNQQVIQEGIFKGDGKSYGIDLFAKYNFKEHTIWVSYTLSKSLEHFSYFSSEEYLFAPQDQRHEIKIASILNFSPFFFSANYVYGSGFLERPYLQSLTTERVPYNRLDISFTYKFTKTKNIGECGISILNVLNTQNQKYSNFERIPLSQSSSASIYFEAMPFTPTLFLKLRI